MPGKASDEARMAAGTHVPDRASEVTSPVLRWALKECRSGSLQMAVNAFAESQPEWLQPGLVLVEKIEDSRLVCRIPCRMADSESPHTFQSDVQFTLNPETGEAVRVVD